MRKVFLGIVIAVVLVFVLRYCERAKDEQVALRQNTALIQKQLNNVGKLIVTEGSYAQVYTYEDWKKLYFDVFSAKKKALVVVNAKASIAYDLSKIETEVNEEAKTVTILSLPEPELTIIPNIEYYDVQQDYLNPFVASDYNKIKKQVEDSLRKTIQKSSLVTNAQNRLLSELQKIYILTNSMGWTLQYNQQSISSETDLQELKL